jgi:hypothetical protein
MTGPHESPLPPDEFDQWLDAQLAALPLFEPSLNFSDRVMASVRMPDPFAIRSIGTARRRLFATPKAVTLAACLALLVLGSMAASVVWTLANRDTMLAFGGWLASEAGQWAWVGVRGAALTLMEQPWFAGFRGLLDEPGRLALASALGTMVYVTGVLALRRLLTAPAPTQRVAHANW